jgi:signal transduction histidine kinase
MRVMWTPVRIRWAVDAGLAVAFTVVAVLLGMEPPPPGHGWHRMDAVGFALTALMNLPIAARNRWPVGVCLVVCGVWALYVADGNWPVINSPAPMLAGYTVATLRPMGTAVACAAVSSVVWWYAGWTAQESSPASVTAQSLVFSALLLRFGRAARLQAEQARQLAAMAEQLRAEQEDRARRAVAEEQSRIARELHDVVAHHMSVISVQAGMAGYVFGSEPDTARAALGTISDTTREALEEMRRMLKVLRADGDEPAGGTASYDAMPSVDRLGEVVERVRAAGVAVELEVVGERRPLAPGVGLCAYRVVQEALTNVLKHAGPQARATVRVAYLPHSLEVTVTDDGAGPSAPVSGADRSVPATSVPRGGHGLIGMRERARLYGGAVEIGPRAEGGFGVHLTLPTSAVAVREGPRGEDRHG